MLKFDVALLQKEKQSLGDVYFLEALKLVCSSSFKFCWPLTVYNRVGLKIHLIIAYSYNVCYL